MILHTDVETLPREELEALQLRRLRATVERCYHTVAFTVTQWMISGSNRSI